MRLVLLGPPGAGKGTQAKRLAAEHSLVQLSTGDMLRTAAQAGSPVGLRIKQMMARGELCPDDVVVEIVADRIEQPDARNGFILDGFPRTLPQAQALDRMLAEKGLQLDAVIEIKVDESILLDRINRRIAEMKGRGEALRDDDDPQVLQARLMAYRAQTAPLTAYYASRSALRTINGMASVADVAHEIEATLRATPGQSERKEAGDGQAGSKRSGLHERRKVPPGPKQQVAQGSPGKRVPPKN